MNAVGAFNSTMIQFLQELCETFPECAQLFVTFELVKEKMEESETVVLETFVKEIAPYSEKLVAMDETFFLQADIEFLKNIGISQYWNDDLEPETKRAIWEYLQTLFVMGSAILTVPPQMLRMIEQYAQQFSERMESGEIDPSQMNIQDIGASVMQQMAGQQGMEQFMQGMQGMPQMSGMPGMPQMPGMPPSNNNNFNLPFSMQQMGQSSQQPNNPSMASPLSSSGFFNPNSGMPMFQMPSSHQSSQNSNNSFEGFQFLSGQPQQPPFQQQQQAFAQQSHLQHPQQQQHPQPSQQRFHPLPPFQPQSPQQPQLTPQQIQQLQQFQHFQQQQQQQQQFHPNMMSNGNIPFGGGNGGRK